MLLFSQLAAHGGQECPPLQAYALAHKGRVSLSDVTFNPEDPPEAYSNASTHSRLSGYSEMARQVHGPDFDPFAQPIDVEILMRAGGGRKHGRLLMADSIIDTASTLLSRRFELGAPTRARPYAHGQAPHRFRWTHSRLFLCYPS